MARRVYYFVTCPTCEGSCRVWETLKGAGIMQTTTCSECMGLGEVCRSISTKELAVMGLDGDDGKHILVVMCLNPIEAYVSKDQIHAGRFINGNLEPPKTKDEKEAARIPKLSERETEMIIRTWRALRNALGAIHGEPT